MNPLAFVQPVSTDIVIGAIRSLNPQRHGTAPEQGAPHWTPTSLQFATAKNRVVSPTTSRPLLSPVICGSVCTKRLPMPFGLGPAAGQSATSTTGILVRNVLLSQSSTVQYTIQYREFAQIFLVTFTCLLSHRLHGEASRSLLRVSWHVQLRVWFTKIVVNKCFHTNTSSEQQSDFFFGLV